MSWKVSAVLCRSRSPRPESILQNTKKDVGSQLNGLAALTGQIEERKRYILAINNDVETIERELVSLNRQLNSLEKDLKRKKKYEASVQYLYKNKSIEEKLMFIFSAKNLGQTYRRMRYVREYTTYQRLQGRGNIKRSRSRYGRKAERQQVKAAKEGLLKERENEKAETEAQEKEKRTLVANLQKKTERSAKRSEQEETGSQSTECPYRPVDRRRNRTCPQTCRGRSPPPKRQPARRRIQMTKVPPETERLPKPKSDHWTLLR